MVRSHAALTSHAARGARFASPGEDRKSAPTRAANASKVSGLAGNSAGRQGTLLCNRLQSERLSVRRSLTCREGHA